MRPRFTGFGLGNAIIQGSVQWDYVQSNKDLARRLVVFLQDKEVLTEPNEGRDMEHADWSRLSAMKIREWLILEQMNVKGQGDLDLAIISMTKACRSFVRAAGPEARNFTSDMQFFQACLTAYREVMLQELRWLVDDYQLPHIPELGAVLPAYN